MDKVTEASTQYNDMRGTAAIDGHTSASDITRIAREQGLPDDYLIMGVKAYSEFDLSQRHPLGVSVTIYAAQMGPGDQSIDDILRRYPAGAPLPVEAFRMQIKPSDVPKMIKRLEIVLKGKLVEDREFSITVDHDFQ